jgi:hypothetical protein
MPHDIAVKLGLVSKPDPALAEISQQLGSRLALRHAQQATAFLGPKSAIFNVVHIIQSPRKRTSSIFLTIN